MSVFSINKRKEFNLCQQGLSNGEKARQFSENLEGLDISWVTMLFKRYPLLCFIPVLIQSILFAVSDTFNTSKWPAGFSFLVATAVLATSSFALLLVFSEVLLPALVAGISVVILWSVVAGAMAAIKQTVHNHQSLYCKRYACENTVDIIVGPVKIPEWKEGLADNQDPVLSNK